jgi:hypothetical protein
MFYVLQDCGSGKEKGGLFDVVLGEKAEINTPVVRFRRCATKVLGRSRLVRDNKSGSRS